MPRGSKPLPPGEADQRSTAHKWQLTEKAGWQHGRKPNPPTGLTDEGKRAWRTWMAAWWASFYDVEDLPGLQLTVMQYDRAMRGDIDVAKAIPLLDRYGITPKGRQDLRWARAEEKPAPAAAGQQDEVAARRTKRAAQLA